MRGPFLGFSGYDQHTRAFVRELVKQGLRVQLEHLWGWGVALPDEQRDPWYECLREPVDAGITLHFTMPQQVRVDPGMKHVNYTMFEADGIPASWAAQARRVDLTVVPTTACRDAWVRSGAPAERVSVSPLGVDPVRFDGSARPLSLDFPNGEEIGSRRFRFLNMGELRPRKNQLALIRTWLSATTPEDDAVLLLKLGVFQPRALQQFQDDLTRMLQGLGRKIHDGAPIAFLTDVLPPDAIPALYAAATHYVSMSCGEGWDLPMMEAGASGLSLVAPNHSAYKDYLSTEIADFIPVTERPAVFEGSMAAEDRIFFKGHSWWPPDEEQAAAIIREIIDGARPPRTAADVLRREFSWERSTRRLIGVLASVNGF